MRVKCRHDLIAHKLSPEGDIFINRKAGETFEISDADLLRDLASDVVIVDYFPGNGHYKLMQNFGKNKAGDIIGLFEDQAGTLVLRGIAEPVDDKLWRPGRPLPHSGKSFLRRVSDAFVSK